MAKKRTTPAKKKYTVLSDCNSLVCQTVMATSPEEAYRIAGEDGDLWESASGSDDGEYRLHHRVWDVESDEFINVAGLSFKHCKTCGSEIVESVNDSNFGDGECGPCEHERYKSQPALLKLARMFRMTCVTRIDLLKNDEDWRPDDEREDMIGHYTAMLNDCKKVLDSYGNDK